MPVNVIEIWILDSNCSARAIAKLIIIKKRRCRGGMKKPPNGKRERKFERTIITLFGESKLAQSTPRLRPCTPGRTLFGRNAIVRGSTMHFPRKKACSHLKLRRSRIYLFNFRTNGCLTRRSANKHEKRGQIHSLIHCRAPHYLRRCQPRGALFHSGSAPRDRFHPSLPSLLFRLSIAKFPPSK